MKKSQLKSLVKSARKTARKSIKLGLVAELKKVAGKLGQGSEKLNKEIEKGSKALAKKLSKELKIDKAALLGTTGKTSASRPTARRKPKADSSRKIAGKTRKPGSKASIPAKPVTSKSPLKVKPKLVNKEAAQTKVESESPVA